MASRAAEEEEEEEEERARVLKREATAWRASWGWGRVSLESRWE